MDGKASGDGIDPTAVETPRTAEPKRQEWTPEVVALFWDYWSTRNDRRDWYFSNRLGGVILRFARSFGLIGGEILDYGFSKGYLLPLLLDEGVGVTGVEFSTRAVAHANERLKLRPNWRGAVAATSLPTPLSDRSFDLILCIEVVEHLLDEWFEPTLSELFRLLKPGGRIFLTTPNAESLAGAELLCPFCHSLFHPVQHVRSVNAVDLHASLVRASFEIEFCKDVDLFIFQRFGHLPNPKFWSPHLLTRVLGLKLLGLTDAVLPRRKGLSRVLERMTRPPGPHLVAVARRPL